MVISCSACSRFIASSKVVFISVLLAVLSLLLFVTVWLNASSRSFSGESRVSSRSLSAAFIFSRFSASSCAAMLRTSSCNSRFFASACFCSSLRSSSLCLRSAASCCAAYSFATARRSSMPFRSVSSRLRRAASSSPALPLCRAALFFIHSNMTTAPMMIPDTR